MPFLRNTQKNHPDWEVLEDLTYIATHLHDVTGLSVYTVLLGISWEGPELTGNFGVRQSVFFESAGYGISIAALSSNGWF
ncbi:MAG: hypothetical protein ACK50J_03905, partial [Planctomyces sp.]